MYKHLSVNITVCACTEHAQQAQFLTHLVCSCHSRLVCPPAAAAHAIRMHSLNTHPARSCKTSAKSEGDFAQNWLCKMIVCGRRCSLCDWDMIAFWWSSQAEEDSRRLQGALLEHFRAALCFRRVTLVSMSNCWRFRGSLSGKFRICSFLEIANKKTVSVSRVAVHGRTPLSCAV